MTTPDAPRSSLHAVPTIEADPLNDLMVAAAAGDESAFGSLYDSLAPLVHGIILRLLRDPARSEEVTQEVFVELWQKAPNFDATAGSVKAFAATVARRRAIDRVRSVESARRRDDSAANAPSEPARSPETIVTDRDDALQTRKALDILTAAQREAIELAFYQGLSYRAIAERLDTPEGTIKTRIRDGMKKLKTELGGAS